MGRGEGSSAYPQVGLSLPKAIHANVAEPPDDVEGDEMDRAFTAFDPASLTENEEQKEKTHKFLRENYDNSFEGKWRNLMERFEQHQADEELGRKTRAKPWYAV